MKRVACVGVLLLLWGSWQVRAGLHGAAFIYKQNAGDEALFQPMIAPKIGVQLEKGPRQMNKGEVLVCKSGSESHKVMDGDQEATVKVLTLTCEDRVFVVKSLYFEEQ